MIFDEKTVQAVAQKYELLRDTLNERQRRLFLGAEAKELGRGGIAAVARATGVHPNTIARGVRELASGSELEGKVRAPGGGRKKLIQTNPELLVRLQELVDPVTRGDPMSPLVWSSKSTTKLAAALSEQEYSVSVSTVGRILRSLGFSLQGNAKIFEGRQHPDRDAQFEYLYTQVLEYINSGDPVISVDTKKKELVGNFKNAGREYQKKGSPEPVNAYDFTNQAVGKAIPYGIYDVASNMGWVTVGQDHDTSAFAVSTLTSWWYTVGRVRYPRARRLLICADGGGSNGSRVRAWKIELAKFANDTDLEVTVCHLPPGTSKWNKIEHRMFSQITANWRGRPLTSFQVIVDLISNTTTATGLTIQASIDPNEYPIGIRYHAKEVENLPMTRHNFHGDWNYTIHPFRLTSKT